MNEVVIYSAERAAGLEAAIRSQTSVASLAQARLGSRVDLPGHVAAHIRATAGVQDFDLKFIECVLTTAGQNRNDDVFLPVELWMAKATPTHKACNLQHDDGQVVGHMLSARAVDGDFKDVPEDTPVDDLPADLQLVVGTVLYAKWSSAARQERMDTLLEEIGTGTWACSMEVMFSRHDFLLSAPNGATEVVTRSEATAHMSKSLKCYGGAGTYAGKTIGRVLRNCVFSGIGLVQNPACEGSVILPPNTQQAVAAFFDGRAEARGLEPLPRPATKVAADIFQYMSR